MSQRSAKIAVAVCLVVVTLLAYEGVRGHDFVSYDDPTYVTENPHVQAGLTLEGLRWAFTTGHGANWHPVTWISHMLDCQLWGVEAGAHHVTNVFLHAVNALLLLALLYGMTGAFGRSAVAAALFALHPLRVESVAWVSERKDVLSACFWLLTMLAYVRYVRRRTWNVYGAVLLLFALGLTAKPMLVTLPVILLLIDFWPLERVTFRTWAPRDWWPDVRVLLLEKVPLFALAALASVVTVIVQGKGGAMPEGGEVPVGARLANAAVSYVTYLWKTVWPDNLAIHYMYRIGLPAWEVAGSVLALVVLSVAAVVAVRRACYLTVGWFWYGVTLLPVIGVIQVGDQAMADRYTYVPSIGILVAVVWGTHALTQGRSRWRSALKVVAVAILFGLVALTREQVRHWSDTVALFTHAIAVTKGNAKAHLALGTALAERGRIQEAEEHYEAAVRFDPEYGEAYSGLAVMQLQSGDLAAAEDNARRAVRLSPASWRAYANLAAVLQAQGDLRGAEAGYRTALELEPAVGELHFHLGTNLLAQDRVVEAIQEFERARTLAPGLAEVRNYLAVALVRAGRPREAVAELQAVVHLLPESADAHYNLGVVLLQLGRSEEAIPRLREALRLQPEHAGARRELNRAEAHTGEN